MSTQPNPLGNLADQQSPYGGYQGGLATEPITGNSLTQYIRSIEGLTGQQGQGILGAGLNETQAGLNLLPGALGQAQSGATAAAPALSYLTSLVKGDQGDLQSAAGPELDAVTQQFDQIRNLISEQPRGGGKASVLAEQPTKEAEQKQNILAQLRSQAPGQLGSLATNLAGVGLGEGQLALGVAGIGQSQEALGQGLELGSANIALTKESQDYGQQASLLSGLL